MKVKDIIFILFIVLTIFITGCTYGSYSIKVGSVDMGKNEVSGSYSEFNGFKSKNYDFEEGDSLNFDTEIETESGELKILLLDEDKNILQEISESGESNYEVKETSDYNIRVEAIEHKGSFSVEIEIK